MTNRHVPPLSWLRAFEAAGRTGSFKAAAEDLNVSPSTISHQVRDLERHMGVLLFNRLSKSIEPTDEGLRYLKPLTSAFGLIEATFTEGLAEESALERDFRIGAFPFLTNEVLLPNIEALKKTLGRANLSFRSETGIDALEQKNPLERLDVVVRYSAAPPAAGALSLELFDIELVPVQAIDKPIIDNVNDVLAQPIIKILGPFDAWSEWATFHQIDEVPAGYVMQTDNYHAATLAATRGDGMCLGVLPFMGPWLREGKIQALERFRSKIPYKAYLVYSSHNRDNPAIPRLRDWLVDYLT